MGGWPIIRMTITNAIITAYCACKVCCGPNAAGLAANGKPPTQGVTVAGPRAFPLGARITIGTNRYVLQDRTAKRFDGRWDIYFENHSDAKRFGKQTNNVRILK